MHYGEIYTCDIANGIGCRTSLFVSGCTHHCKGCFNECTWDFHYGNLYTDDTEDTIIESLKPKYINGLTILGGEPMEILNQPYIWQLIKRVRDEVHHATIWLYSGYTYEELNDINNKRCYCGSLTKSILKNIDVLVDGEFIEEQKDISLRFKGSTNQRIIDMRKTRETGEIILLEV